MSPEEELAALIAANEAATGQRSPLRDAVPVPPTEGIDQPTLPSWLGSAIAPAPPATEGAIPWLDAVPLPPVDVTAATAQPLREPAPREAVPGAIDLPTLDVFPPDVPEPPKPELQTMPWDIAGPGKQAVSKFVGGMASLPLTLAAGVASVPSFINTALGDPRADEMASTVDWLSEKGQNVRDYIGKALGVGEAKTAPEKIGAFGGEVLTPAGKLTVPFTALSAAIHGTMGLLRPTPAEAGGPGSGRRPMPPEEKERRRLERNAVKAQQKLDRAGAKQQKEILKQQQREELATQVV